MTKQDAYNFFLGSLAIKILEVQEAMDAMPDQTDVLRRLRARDAQLQRLLAVLDEIVDAV
ncbi:hypothetical protein [Paraburkholderia bryophila]|uniref:Uncharacterized protein n=1 Tax=Paraburkholderia bryophila TaxID=420952 RepID=A0A7Y9WIQ0_9BURK|nr:hypothetical protein [Paraburkholderia bryophila]NYH21030.1 hypothetical protein [Paraburkholderia bryophila]